MMERLNIKFRHNLKEYKMHFRSLIFYLIALAISLTLPMFFGCGSDSDVAEDDIVIKSSDEVFTIIIPNEALDESDREFPF